MEIGGFRVDGRCARRGVEARLPCNMMLHSGVTSCYTSYVGQGARQEGGTDGNHRHPHRSDQHDHGGNPLADRETEPTPRLTEEGPEVKQVPRGRLPPRYRKGTEMELLIGTISIAALALSIAALIVAIRGARRGR